MGGGQQINIGSIYADLDVNSDKLERGLARGRQAVDAIQRELEQLDAELMRGSISAQDYANRIVVLNQTLAELQNRMQIAYGACQNLGHGLSVVNAGMTQTADRAAAAGRFIMQLGYMADDAQYGFQALVNNIGPATLAFTQMAGIAGPWGMAIAAGAQVGAAGVYQLYRHWDDLVGLFQESEDPLRTEAELMEELAAQTKRTAEETKRLNEYEKEQLERKKQLNATTDDQDKAEKKLDSAIKNAAIDVNGREVSGRERIEAGLRDAFADAGSAHGKLPIDRNQAVMRGAGIRLDGPEAKAMSEAFAEHANAKDAFDREVAQNGTSSGAYLHLKDRLARAKAKLDEVEGRVRARIEERVQGRINGLIDDPKKRKEFARLVEENHQFFPPGLAKDLEDALPENVRQQKDFEEKGKAEAVRLKIKQDASEKARKQQDRFRKVMTDFGARLKKGFWNKVDDVTKENGRAAKKDDELKDKLNAAGLENEAAGPKEQEEGWKKFVKESAHKARDKVGGIDDIAEDAALRAHMAGGGPAAMGKALGIIGQILGANGMEGKAGAVAAQEILGDANRKLQGEATRRALRGDEGRERFEQFSASDLAAKVQAGVGGADKATSQRDKMIEHLAALLRQGRGTFRVRVGN